MYTAALGMKMKWWNFSIASLIWFKKSAFYWHTTLHGFLPVFKHIDHIYPDAAIAIAAAKDDKPCGITDEFVQLDDRMGRMIISARFWFRFKIKTINAWMESRYTWYYAGFSWLVYMGRYGYERVIWIHLKYSWRCAQYPRIIMKKVLVIWGLKDSVTFHQRRSDE